MAELPPFNPNSDFDALSDFFRQQLAMSASRALRIEAYARLSPSDQVTAMVAGISTALVGVAFALVDDEGRDAMMQYIVDTLPYARQQAEGIIDSGEQADG